MPLRSHSRLTVKGSAVIPHAPDGHPDLQGIWLNSAGTPFERPKEFAAHPRLTDDEVVEFNRRATKIFSNPKSDAATADGYFISAYNNLEVFKSGGATDSAERVTEIVIDNRTALITDPPDGRLPAYTEAGRLRRTAYGRSRSAPGVSLDGPEQVCAVRSLHHLRCPSRERSL